MTTADDRQACSVPGSACDPLVRWSNLPTIPSLPYGESCWNDPEDVFEIRMTSYPFYSNPEPYRI